MGMSAITRNLATLVVAYMALLIIAWQISNLVFGMVLILLPPAIAVLVLAYRDKPVVWKLRRARMWTWLMPIIVVSVWVLRDPQGLIEKLLVLICFLAYTIMFDISFSRREADAGEQTKSN